MSKKILPLLLLLCLSAYPQTRQVERKPVETTENEQEKAEEKKSAEDKKPEDKSFKGMKYRSIGPFRGGRSLTVSGVAGDPEVYYFGSAGGGVWKSTDGGLTWASSFDKAKVGSIGSLAVSQSEPSILYAGTGEACIRGNISHGDGVYKSLDSGKSWKNIGLRDTRAIGKIIIHPRNPDIAYVAALGHPFGPNVQRGIFRTRDGGQTWDKVLYKDENTGGIDVAMDPRNPNILFAALWQARRTPYSLTSGGPGSGLYRSADGGTTWKRLEENGLPKGPYGRIGVSVAPNSERIYALIEAHEGGLYRSDDGGEKWELVNDSRYLQQRAWYYMHIFADPQNPDTVYSLEVDFHKSTDGGRTFNKVKVPHGDNHGLWIDPTNTRRIIAGNDGGATITTDGGKHWSPQENQPTAQFYHVITDNRFPYYVYGAQQDNSTIAISSRGVTGAIERPDWYPVGGGEAGYIAPYPPDPSITFAGDYEGTLTRYDKKTDQLKSISPWPEVSDGTGAATLEHRFQWTAPLIISPHDPNVIYHGGEMLFKSSDAGSHFEAISPDLTRNDKSKQQVSGGPINKDDTGTEYYDTIFSIAESPLQAGQIWVGTDDGLVHITRDGGKTWKNITPGTIPEWSRISLIEASPHDAGTAYLAADRHQWDDLQPYIYKTSDFGATWTKITAGIPASTFVRAVREDPARRGLLYAGAETGVYVSFDDGIHWRAMQLNLPVAPVHDLVVKNEDLVLATHGRSFWILNDLTPLRQYNAGLDDEAVHLYAPKPAYRMHNADAPPKPVLVGENPPGGAVIYYYLKTKPKGETTIEILDPAGNLIRKFSSERKVPLDSPPDPDDEKPKKQIEPDAGLNRFVWDMRSQSVPTLPNYYLFEYKNGARGPLALPGNYQVRLTTDGQTLTSPLEIKADPRVNTNRADLEKQFSLLNDIKAEMTRLYQAVNQIQDLRQQMKDMHKRLGDGAEVKPLLAASSDLEKKMLSVENELVEMRIKANEDSLAYPAKLDAKLAVLALIAGGDSDSAPTEPTFKVYEKLKAQTDIQLARWAGIVSTDLPALQKMIMLQNINPIILAPPSASGGGEAQR